MRDYFGNTRERERKRERGRSTVSVREGVRGRGRGRGRERGSETEGTLCKTQQTHTCACMQAYMGHFARHLICRFICAHAVPASTIAAACVIMDAWSHASLSRRTNQTSIVVVRTCTCTVASSCCLRCPHEQAQNELRFLHQQRARVFVLNCLAGRAAGSMQPTCKRVTFGYLARAPMPTYHRPGGAK